MQHQQHSSTFTTARFLQAYTTTTTSSPLANSSDYNYNDLLVVDHEESYEDYFDPRLPRWIAVVIFLIGIFGNLLSILVFFQKKMRKNSTFVYLAFLCVVDLFVILFGLGDILVISYFRVIIRSQSFLLCRFHTFFIYTSTHLSSFILASVSVDRAIATNCLTFAKTYCTPKYAYKILFINFLMAVAINFHSLIFLGYDQETTASPSSNSTNGPSSSQTWVMQNRLMLKCCQYFCQYYFTFTLVMSPTSMHYVNTEIG